VPFAQPGVPGACAEAPGHGSVRPGHGRAASRPHLRIVRQGWGIVASAGPRSRGPVGPAQIPHVYPEPPRIHTLAVIWDEGQEHPWDRSMHRLAESRPQSAAGLIALHSCLADASLMRSRPANGPPSPPFRILFRRMGIAGLTRRALRSRSGSSPSSQ
jgi:hypothetical protein